MQPGNNETNDAAILRQVKVVEFRATPSLIGPFGAATLEWEVTGPPGFNVLLGGIAVGNPGGSVEHPTADTEYILEARAGEMVENLAYLTVQVDTSTCVLMQHSGVVSQLLLEEVNSLVMGGNPGLTPQVLNDPFRVPPSWINPHTIAFSPGLMSIRLHYNITIHHLTPNLDISIDAGLKLGEAGKLELLNPSISVSASEGWFVEHILPLELVWSLLSGSGVESALVQLQSLIDGIPSLISNEIFMLSEGQRYQTVSIPGDPVQPSIMLVACTEFIPPRFPFPIGWEGDDA
jgi:hypothetical protein